MVCKPFIHRQSRIRLVYHNVYSFFYKNKNNFFFNKTKTILFVGILYNYGGVVFYIIYNYGGVVLVSKCCIVSRQSIVRVHFVPACVFLERCGSN